MDHLRNNIEKKSFDIYPLLSLYALDVISGENI